MRASMPPIEQAFAQHWPEALLVHLLDDALPSDLERAGAVDDAIVARFCALTRYAVDAGADAVLFTCSAFGRAIAAAAATVHVPVHAPNDAMLQAAASAGPRIALLATFAPTLTSMLPTLRELLASRTEPPQVVGVHVEGALAALQRGDVAAHDARIVAAARAQPAGTVIALAQFSMVRAATAVASAVTGPVLTTPESAVRALREQLTERTDATNR